MKYLILSLCVLVVLSGCSNAGTGTYADSIATYDEYVSYLMGAWEILDEETGEGMFFSLQGKMSMVYSDGSTGEIQDFELNLEGGRMYWMWDDEDGRGHEAQYYMEIESKDRFRIRPMIDGNTFLLGRK